ncbi:MAG: phosphate ABC transporter permease PstA [Thaumarchaeota archaeon]|nr:phosphate ABC transporter permease PstA [Nitrososphaerota archaeon]
MIQKNEYEKQFYKNIRCRLIINKIINICVILAVVFALIPLGSIIFEVFKNGITAISIEFLTEVPGAIGAKNGGIGPAIQGTLLIILFSSLIGIPIGLFSGIFLYEFHDRKLARIIRFVNDVFMELPTIIIGIFTFLVIVLTLGYFTILAGSFALSLIMIPIISKTTEESLKMVPMAYKEAGTALGLQNWIISIKIIMVTAKKGILNGILLSVARISGETAPLIMTTLGSSQFFHSFNSPIDSLPLRIWRFSLLPYDEAQTYGWGSALVLIFIIIMISIIIRYAFNTRLFKIKT